MTSRHRPHPAGSGGDAEHRHHEVYNILPIHDVLTDHPSLRFPEVRAAMAALRAVGDLRIPPFHRWPPAGSSSGGDLLDWLGLFFGFQRDNVRNQREHLVLLLANAQMRRNPQDISSLDPAVVRRLRRKLLKNYSSWCSYLGRTSNVWISDARAAGGIGIGIGVSGGGPPDPRRELLYVSLYLLIWGEAANLRFLPECLCYIFHHMAMELNRILEGYVDENTGALALPFTSSGENAFLVKIVTPIYQTVSAEVSSSGNGTAPHAAWRNYDDINEYFWSNRCFESLRWPMDLSRNFFAAPPNRNRVGKTGFVEQRSYWNLYRNFDRLWVALALFLQAAAIVAWEEKKYPWQGLQSHDVRVRLLTVFITWAGMRFIQSILDVGTQFALLSRETPMLGVRMMLKSIAAAAWTVAFSVLYSRIWDQRDRDRRWSPAANSRVTNFLEAAAVFVLPEVLALVLSLVPWLRNFVEKANWKVLRVFTWWFQSRIFVGRGLKEGVFDTVMYSLFWVVVLAVKCTFSYFLQIKPMVAPTKSILKLDDVQYRWHQFFDGANRFAVVVLWLPVVLIYLMDLSIWYAIFSSMSGALVGLFSHLGEIRNVQQLRLRFQFFAGAMQFNLIPEEQLFKEHGTLKNRLRNWALRLKLRYGLGRPYTKIESNELEKTRFFLIWNEIIAAFREEDIISNHELELLELPNCKSWGIHVIQWPCVLLANELQLALSQAKELNAPDRVLWRKICKNEYRRCAVTEAYDSVKFLLLSIIKRETEEHSIASCLLSGVDDAISFDRFTQCYKTSVLPSIHAKLVVLTDLLIKPPKDLNNKLVNTLQALYEIAIRDFPKIERSIEELKGLGWVAVKPSPTGLLFENAVALPDAKNTDFYKQVRRLHTILTSKDSMKNVPRNLEARRRIAFFSNSLFMNMPRAPHVEKMLAFCVLTPYFNEQVLYSKDQLQNKNEDGISILYYLQKIYADEWENFLERMREEGMTDKKMILDEKPREVQLWASHRGQTLTRTVRGMMYYYRALKMLAFLDSASEMDMLERSKELDVLGSESSSTVDLESSGRLPSQNLSRTNSSIGFVSSFEDQIYGTALMKFTYVVACQIYGVQKAKKDPIAQEILNLMKDNEALRVAYADEVENGRGGKEYYSVLVKYDQQFEKEVEIYRVRLPGPLKLGEGKPENQNHAIIFTRGEAVQTIDMNQDNYFEEALKMRNLLEEYSHKYGRQKPTILGVREHIFTGSVSSLAWFMSAQETSFVTLGQRVLANPLKVRMHYGHPDVFDRLWFLSRGGISKASRVINISEDIFAGFNCTLRGGNVTHHEYIQVGKGRDVGLNQISLFEAKVASGNGEQVSSRDVYRLGHRLDFFRMLSFYHTTVGFYFNTLMVIWTVYAFVWGRLYLALSGLEDYIADSTSNNTALGSVLNQQFIIQLGLFTALPMIVENSLEHGFLSAVWDFIKMQLQLASVFFTFSMGTRSHFFGRTILHGGAKYQATGRGFVVEHKNFSENYRQYARSHFVKAIELGLILTVYASYSPIAKGTFVYIALTISSWFLVLSWILAPFVFNPSGFDWLKTYDDFEEFMNWIWNEGGVSTTVKQSWETWWYQEQDHLRTTGLWGKLLEVILDLRFFFFQYGIVYQLNIADGSSNIAVYLLSWIYVVVAVGMFVLISYARDKYAAREHIYYRSVQSFIVISTILLIVILLKFTKFEIADFFTSLLAFIPTGWGLISIALVIRPFLKKFNMLWDTVVSLARFYDIMFGTLVMAPVAFLAWAPGFQSMQTRILFNEAFSRGLQISRIIVGKRHTGKAQKADRKEA